MICVDFDGTCVTHEFPEVGDDVPGAVEVLRELVDAKHQLVLWTLRSDSEGPGAEGKFLTRAVEWFQKHKIPLYGVNNNPSQRRWSASPKAEAQVYIDDAALGCPLIYPDASNARPYVNWSLVREFLAWQEILPEEPE